MLKIIAVMRIIAAMFPLVVEFIRQIEAAFPEKEQGSMKREMLRELLQAAYVAAADGKISFDEVWPLLDKTIAIIVDKFNIAGVFKK